MNSETKKQTEHQDSYDFVGGSMVNGFEIRIGGEPPAWIELTRHGYDLMGNNHGYGERFQLVRTEAGRTYVYVGHPEVEE